MTLDWRKQLLADFPQFAQLTTGKAEKFGVSIRNIQLKSNSIVSLESPGVTAFVGGNNTGKSTLLQEISHILQSPSPPGSPLLSVESIELKKSGNVEDLTAWLGENSRFSIEDGRPGFIRGNSRSIALSVVEELWKSNTGTLGHLASYLVLSENAAYRFSAPQSVERRWSVDDPPIHPLHYLEYSPSLFKQVKTISADTFGLELTLDPLGQHIFLRVGEVKAEVPRVDAISADYRDEMVSLPKLDRQGDGVRGFINQLLPIITGAYRIVIIDEPEAFLHPPQAHSLGVYLGKLAAEKGIQILLATHDKALLTGLLDSNADISVVRLEREEGTPTSRSLEPGQLRTLWSDPALKYTNVLDGLFHRLVVVAEAEGDCAYLRAAMDYAESSARSIPRNEIQFVPTGGIAGMAKVCSALTAIGVPVVVAPDLDVLSNKSRLRDLVESLGSDWDDELEKTWTIATAPFKSKAEPVKNRHVLNSVKNVLEGKLEEPYSGEVKAEILGHLRTTISPWDEVKRYGIAAFRGDALISVERLLTLLSSIGIVPVREGELERLAPDVSSRKGSGWLTKALEQNAHRNQLSQDHIDRIITAGIIKLKTHTYDHDEDRRFLHPR